MSAAPSPVGRGFVHVYTGNGKGKTTAALGLALRAFGAGLRCLIIQFMKGQHYSELDAVRALAPLVTIEQYGSEKFCRPDDESLEEHRALARTGLDRARRAIADRQADVIVLDEIITASVFRLVETGEILECIRSKPDGVELVLTGRGAGEEVIRAADLVTEMREIKHYYERGIQARKGIES